MLSDWYQPDDRDRFRNGLAVLDRQSRQAYGRSFVDCAPGQQSALLEAFDGEVAALRRAAVDPAPIERGSVNPDEHWFAMLKFLTISEV
jgi:hypothetical protein